MRNVIQSLLVTVALGSQGMAAPPDVRPVTASRITRALTAIRDSTQTYLAAREIRLDLDFPSGNSGKGKLFVLFEPSTGLFFHTYSWERNDYPEVAWIDNVETRSRIAVSTDRLVIVTCGNAVGILESAERAASLEDAEAQSLKWMSDHLSEVEERLSGNVRVTSLQLDRNEFPKGFFPEYDQRPGLPLKLMDMVRRDAGWDLTIENTDNHRTIKLIIRHQGDTWVRGGVRVDQAQE